MSVKPLALIWQDVADVAERYNAIAQRRRNELTDAQAAGEPFEEVEARYKVALAQHLKLRAAAELFETAVELENQ